MTSPVRVSDLWDEPTGASPVRVSDLWDEPAPSPSASATRIGPRGIPIPVGKASDASPLDVAASAWRGATFGFGDEALNAVRALPEARRGLEAYADKFVGLQNASDNAARRFAADHPVADLAAGMAGGLLTGSGLVPKSIGAVPNTAGVLAKAGGAIKRIGAGAGVGAVAGGLAGAGDPGPDQSRAEGLGRGAMAGAALGGAVTTAGEVLSPTLQVVRRMAGRYTPAEVAGRYADDAGKTASDFLARADAQTAQGKAPTVADAMGPTGVRMGRDAASKSPQAADALQVFGEARTAPSVASSEIVRDVATATGITPRPTILTQRILDDARKQMANKVYPILRSDPTPIDDPVVLDALHTDLGRKAYQAAARLAHSDTQAAAVSGRARVPFVPVFDAEGRMVQAPNLATLDWIKRGMDELLSVKPSATPGVGETLSQGEMRSLREIRKVLMDRLDALGEANPTLKAYAQVRGEQEQAFMVVEAMTRGFRRFKAATIAEGAVTDDLTRLAQEATDRGIEPTLMRAAYQQAAIDAFATRIRSGSLDKAEQLGAIRSLRALGVGAAQVDDLLGRVKTTQERQFVGETFRRLLGGGDDHVGGNVAASGADVVTGNAPGGARNIFKAMRPAIGAGLTRGNAPAVADALTANPRGFLPQVGAAQSAEATRRNRFLTEGLLAMLLGQQAGGTP